MSLISALIVLVSLACFMILLVLAFQHSRQWVPLSLIHSPHLHFFVLCTFLWQEWNWHRVNGLPMPVLGGGGGSLQPLILHLGFVMQSAILVKMTSVEYENDPHCKH